MLLRLCKGRRCRHFYILLPIYTHTRPFVVFYPPSQAADIGNTFNEYCEMSSLRPDYEREYPTVRQQEVFFWHYLVRYDPSRAQRFSSSYARRQRIQPQTNTTHNHHHRVDDCTTTKDEDDDNQDEDNE